MKRILILAAVLAGIFGLARAADSVEPATLCATNNRGDNATYYTDAIFYKGASLLFTNCVLQTTGTVVQGLSDVSIQLKWGNATSNQVFTPSVTSTNLGKWTLNMTVPTNWDMPSIQIKITDSQTNSFIYPWRLVHVKAAM